MFLNEGFIKLYEELDSLTEAKADTQKLIDFAGEDLANRFLAVKARLKSPANDLYYWIKNKSVEELEQAVSELENTKSKNQMTKDLADQGAELICDSKHWLVYHITTFEAAQKYGRDSRWCITGINDWGDRYWNDYRSHNIEFYFFITKQNYDPRGEDSKFALAYYPDGHGEIFDQRDNQISSIEEIPHYEEIEINGFDLEDLDIQGNYYYCCCCDTELDEDSCYIDNSGDIYCETCFDERFFNCHHCEEICSYDNGYWELPGGQIVCDNCFANSDYTVCPECDEVCDIEDMTENIFGEEMCLDCFDDFLDTDRGYAEIFLHHCEGYSEGDFTDEKDVAQMIKYWNEYKGELNYTEEEIEQYEKNFIENAKACDDVVIDPTVFINIGDDSDDYRSSYSIRVEGSKKELENYDIPDSQALKEIITFIQYLTQEEKDKVSMSWDWVDDDGELGGLVVSIYGPSDGEAYEERTIANWPYAENLIRKALGLSVKN